MVPVGIKNIYPFVCIAALVAVAFAVFGGNIFRHDGIHAQPVRVNATPQDMARLKLLASANRMPPTRMNAAPLYIKAAAEVLPELNGPNSGWFNIMYSENVPLDSDYAILAKETVRAKAIFAELDAARRKPKCVFDLNTRTMAGDNNSPLARGLRGLSLLITARSFILAHKGDPEGATINERSILEYARPLSKSEPELAYRAVYYIFHTYYRGLHNISVIAGGIKSRRPS